jgi:hypothetical protein
MIATPQRRLATLLTAQVGKLPETACPPDALDIDPEVVMSPIVH